MQNIYIMWSNQIQCDPIKSNVIQSNPMWSNQIQFDPTWSNLIRFDLIWSDLIQFDPIWSNLILSKYLIEKLTKVRLMPVRKKLSPWVRLKNNHYYCLRLQRASLIIKFILDHFSLKQQLSFSLLVYFICGVLTSFSVLLSLYLMYSD